MSIPVVRWSHAATLINTTLFLSGGTTQDVLNQTSILDEVLALDLSRPWLTSNPLFTAVSNLRIPLSGHVMNQVQGTLQLLVDGGESSTNTTTASPLFLYDTSQGNSGAWTVPSIPKTTTASALDSLRRLYHASLTTGKDGALIQGGYLLTPSSSSSNHTTNGTTTKTSIAATTTTVSTNNNSSTIVSSLLTLSPSQNFVPENTTAVSLAKNAPALAQHTMTLTPDGRAIILGGINPHGVLANLSQAYVMDTQSDKAEWNVVPISGTPPESRVSFSTVMVNTTTMVIYGGTADFKNAFWVTFYLDLPSMSWSAPPANGVIPKRWGHTATMAGTTMVVMFGVTSHRTQDKTNVVLLDTTTNTWITQYDPTVLMPDDNPNTNNSKKGGQLRIGVVLAIAFFVTAFLVGSTFWLFVRRRKRRTRNTIARETVAVVAVGGEQSARRVLQSQDEMRPQSFLGRFGSARNSFADQQRVSLSMETQELNHEGPLSILANMAQVGQNPISLGYPDDVVQHGTGAVPVSGYIYPNQANVTSEKSSRNGHEALVVFHALSRGQQEALRLTKKQHGQERTRADLYGH